MIGNIKKFPLKLKNKINKVQSLTKSNNRIQINMALNYGSKEEILNSISILKKKKLSLNEKNLEKHLYTYGIPDPDILIRSGNTKRISNFLLWQITYTEIFFEKKMWPEFTKRDFYKVIKKYETIKRNFGGLNDRN